MPIPRKCKETGAIIFDLTPEEQGIQESRQEYERLNQEMKEKLALLDNVLKQQK